MDSKTRDPSEAAETPDASDAAPLVPAKVAPTKPALPAETNPVTPPAKAAPKPQPKGPKAAPAREPVSRSYAKPRHFGVLFSFIIMVLVPVLIAAWYLWTRAADQYASTVGFSVRTEEVSSAFELLGGITELSGSSSSDTDILYEFLQSQKLVSDIDNAVDLRGKWSKPENDPYFTYQAPGSIEDLLKYWGGMVSVSYDSGTGLIEVRVLAFTSEDATEISQAIFDHSTEMINELSAIAREDSIRYAREELDKSVNRLKAARQAMNAFRNRYQIVDPTADIQTQTGLLATLQAQLAEALIEYDLLVETTRDNDPRITQASRRIKVIENRIAEERQKLGVGESGDEGNVFANVMSEYESLVVDREFAEQTYTGALAAYDAALAEARRQSRYLAAYVLPTRSEVAQFPQRGLTLGLLSLFLFLLWGILVLTFYALKDRR